MRLLSLGDSYTIGEGVDESARWPVLLAEVLAGQGVPTRSPDIVAVTGWTTGELVAGIGAGAPRGSFDLVTLLIGVNDQYRGRQISEFIDGFRSLMERAIGLASGRPERVIAISIPDWGVTPFASGRERAEIAASIDRYNAEAREIAGHAGAQWVDVTGDSRAHPDDVVADGLHPSAAAYRRWTALILPTALAALARP